MQHEDNWLAFAVAILHPKEITPETAFLLLYPEYRERQTMEFVLMRRAGLTYRQIGSIYGISKDAVYKRIKRLPRFDNMEPEVKSHGKEQMAAGQRQAGPCRKVGQGRTERTANRKKPRDQQKHP